ncbi:hypothetical protein AAFF_G00167830 [Aldrovandia affinis]|uniref:Uncharacterized protein n=1 Tax=Aldrovandia affinis TaxID=143900 RepID=A0AAD7W7H6_9TELE|nr:hypothetical protein AAFF_G00167830 [Aldrovandia affinis]
MTFVCPVMGGEQGERGIWPAPHRCAQAFLIFALPRRETDVSAFITALSRTLSPAECEGRAQPGPDRESQADAPERLRRGFIRATVFAYGFRDRNPSRLDLRTPPSLTVDPLKRTEREQSQMRLVKEDMTVYYTYCKRNLRK